MKENGGFSFYMEFSKTIRNISEKCYTIYCSSIRFKTFQ